MKLHVQTYLGQDADETWWANIDAGEVLGETATQTLEQVQGFRVGPFATREEGLAALKGDLRKIVMDSVRCMVEKHGAQIERIEFNDNAPERME